MCHLLKDRSKAKITCSIQEEIIAKTLKQQSK